MSTGAPNSRVESIRRVKGIPFCVPVEIGEDVEYIVWRGVYFDFGFDDLGNRHRRVRYRDAAQPSANAAQDSRENA
ncbi:MAG: hypothetical protein ACJAYI_001566 [Myxococcota bacterium]|jgi:hypothetical protein